MNQDAPEVSVCIANYNGEHLLPDCLESIRSQMGVRAEVIIHDDASSDGSLALLRQHHPEAQLIVSERNVGFCIANNRMVAQARGRYVLLLNNDAALLPGALVTLKAFADSRPAAVLTLPQFDWQSGVLVDRGCYLDLTLCPAPNQATGARQVAYGIGACLWLPRDLWIRLGGFPAWMESIGEDLYLCSRARLEGAEVWSLDESGYRHRQGSSFGGNRLGSEGLSSTYHRRYLSERNRLAALLVLTPTPLVWPWLLVNLALLLSEGLLLSAFKREPEIFGKIYARAASWLLRNWRLLRKERMEVQRGRRISLVNYLKVFKLLPRKLVLLFRHGFPELRQ